MLNTMFTKGAIPVLEKVVAFTEQRHRVLANNIANIDTPYFKARDLPVEEFNGMLVRALQERERTNPRFTPFHGTRNLSLRAMGQYATTMKVRDLKQNQINMLAHDENKRSIEVEMTELTKNGMRHNAM